MPTSKQSRNKWQPFSSYYLRKQVHVPFCLKEVQLAVTECWSDTFQDTEVHLAPHQQCWVLDTRTLIILVF